MRTMSIRACFALLVAVLVSARIYAQDASRIYVEPTGWALGTNVGITDLWGDVGTKSILSHYTNGKYFDKTVFMGGIFGRYTIHPCLAGRIMLNFGTLYANDNWNEEKAKKATKQGAEAYQRYARNQDAKTYVLENTYILEFTPFRYNPEKERAERRGQFYMMAGIGFFWFKNYSTAGQSGKWVATADLHLEGEGFGDKFPKAYSALQPCIPVGIGYRFDIGKHMNLGFEFLYRKTFTDYLDGVSNKYIDKAEYAKHMSADDAALAFEVADKSWQKRLFLSPQAAGNMRGNPSSKDGYSSFGITYYYRIPTPSKKWWKQY